MASNALAAFVATALGEIGSGADDEENEPFYAEPPAPPMLPPAPPAPPPAPLPLLPPIVEWMTESERTSTAVTLSLVTMAMWAVCCLYCAVRAVYVRSAKQRYGVAASDSAALSAKERTDAAVEAAFAEFPERWKAAGITTSEFPPLSDLVDCPSDQDGLRNRRFTVGAQAAVAQLTRAVPLYSILDRSPKTGLMFAGHKDYPERTLRDSWGLSTPQPNLRTFMSHVWAADPKLTTIALNAHFKSQIFSWYFLALFATMFAVVFLFPLLCAPLLLFGFVGVRLLVFSGSPTVNKWFLWFLGYGGASVWMDKATVKQTSYPPESETSTAVKNLNTAGVLLFPWYLLTAKEIWIVYSETYLQRIWCVYELATWITINGAKNIQFIGIENYGLLYSRLFLHFNYLGVLLAISIVGGGLAFPILFYRNPARTGDPTQFDGPFRIGLTLAIVYFTYVVVIWGWKLLPHLARSRKAIVYDFRHFSVGDARATMPADIKLVHGMIREQHGTLANFQSAVRGPVANAVERLMWRVELKMIGLLVCLYVLLAYATSLWLRFAFGGLKGLILPNLFIDLGLSESAVGAAGLLFMFWVMFAMPMMCYWPFFVTGGNFGCFELPRLSQFVDRLFACGGRDALALDEGFRKKVWAARARKNVVQPSPSDVAAYVDLHATHQGGPVATPAAVPAAAVPAAVPVHAQPRHPPAQPAAVPVATPVQQYQVAVPAGVAPGQAFAFQLPDGRQLQLTCPPGVAPGGHVMVKV